MNTLEPFILGYLVNSLWQLPLLYAAAWLATRLLRPLGPAIAHRIWALTLLAQALLPALSLVSLPSLPTLFAWLHPAQPDTEAHVSIAISAGFIHGTLHLPTLVESLITALYLLTALYFCTRFLWRAAGIARIRREALPLPPGSHLTRLWDDFQSTTAHHDVTLRLSTRVFGPATIGVFRKLILLPAGLADTLSEADFRTILAHELAHLGRRDFARNLACELLTIPIDYHPFLWLTREAVVETREMVCDREAAATIGPAPYTQSLLRLASLLLTRPPARAPHAIGIFDANALERRLMTLTRKPIEVHGLKRAVLLATCLAFGAGTCGTALALRMHVAQPATQAQAQTPTPDQAPGQPPLKVEAGVIAANVENKVVPVYPVEAKAKRISGAVVLHAIIGKDGKVDQLTVLSGPEVLQKSALDAVSKWTYKPYLLNGDPIPVDTTITVTYSFSS